MSPGNFANEGGKPCAVHSGPPTGSLANVGRGIVSDADWIALPSAEDAELHQDAHLLSASLRDSSTRVQDYQKMEARLRTAEAERRVANQEAARLREAVERVLDAEELSIYLFVRKWGHGPQTPSAALKQALSSTPSSSNVIWQARLARQMVRLLVEHVVPVGGSAMLTRCRICNVVSVDRHLLRQESHQSGCEALSIFLEWNHATVAPTDDATAD
jgi:hypothetical protein